MGQLWAHWLAQPSAPMLALLSVSLWELTLAALSGQMWVRLLALVSGLLWGKCTMTTISPPHTLVVAADGLTLSKQGWRLDGSSERYRYMELESALQ
jgi:hypothetical protein